MCRQGCPIQTPIPMMIKAFKEGDLNEAGEMLFSNNPMSMICSLVCNHEKQCEGHCVLGRKGEPVHISSIENYVSDTYFDKIILSEDLGVMKPWPEIFHFALSATQSELRESLMIGDSWDADIVGAHGVGMHQAYYNVSGRTDFPFRPTYSMTDLKELVELL